MSSKIIRLAVTNILRIEAAEIKPDGSLVIVAGDNDQGKSSLLNCIGLALSGKNQPAVPVRQGAPNGEIILETEELVVTRSFSVSGTKKLEVRDKVKGILTSPQTKLDTLFRLTTFDPLTFTRMEPKAQIATLRDLAGLDTSDLDAEYSTKFAERTEVGRRRDDQDGRTKAIVRDHAAPKELVSVTELTQQLQVANTANAENAKAREAVTDLIDGVEEKRASVGTKESALREAEARLSVAKQQLEESKQELIDAVKEADGAAHKAANLRDVDTAGIIAAISGAEETNNKVRANQSWDTEHARLVELQGAYQKLTERLAGIQGTRESRLAKAKFPVDGLAFDDTGVTFDGVPFQQCSSSKQIRVSLAIACALNPELRVMLIRDGSLLDAKSLELVRKYAEKHDAMIFMECVGKRDDATVIIEGGNVVATPLADAKAAKKKKQ